MFGSRPAVLQKLVNSINRAPDYPLPAAALELFCSHDYAFRCGFALPQQYLIATSGGTNV
jgi:hypothetical protein